LLDRPPVRRPEAREDEPERLTGPAGPLSNPGAARLEGRRPPRESPQRPGEAGRFMAVPALAPARAAPVDGAALGRALRAGHRPGQALRLARAHAAAGGQ